MSSSFLVDVRRETLVFPTHEPHWPDVHPMFLEKRVYQGSSGRVYPLPFTDRIAENSQPRAWAAVIIENEYLKITILPELGGRIHRAQDKTNGYDIIYYQPVIKPALVGLAGPWASGGIEFNWPQHHRPSTFMPADVEIEKHPDGSVTVWLSEHDPMARMKGMHGVRLHPGKSYLEVVARVYNRTADVQTFLWWANVATKVHEQYQSFFPPDIAYVADHAKRAVSTFPRCGGRYYGVDYAERARHGVFPAEMPTKYIPPHGGAPAKELEGVYPPDDLSWYGNIPVPTSYMAMGSSGDFSGGYDYRARAGIVHVSNHHISPGKKQWTWGNHDFGYAWDRNLTAADAQGEFAPYIELMAGVYTDNQPDFSFLQPGETKTWSQFWYPLRAIGPVHKASIDAAVAFRVKNGIARIGVIVTAHYPEAVVRLECNQTIVGEWTQLLSPANPLRFETIVASTASESEFTLSVLTKDRKLLISYQPEEITLSQVPASASEPAEPENVESNDRLFAIGIHLEQYRHATRLPEAYWREGLKRDPGDARCHLALGRWHLRRGEHSSAEKHLRASVARATSLNLNPYDGEVFYQLGMCLRHQAFALLLDPAKLNDAYTALYKSTWNYAWQSAGYHALAEIDMLRHEWTTALDHLNRSLRVNNENLRARDLKVVTLRNLGRTEEANHFLRETLSIDPVDWWARYLAGEVIACDQQVRFDLVLDFCRAGLFTEALEILKQTVGERANLSRATVGASAVRLPNASLGTKPMVGYYRAWIYALMGNKAAQQKHLVEAAKAAPDYCFPFRLEEIIILERAQVDRPEDARAAYYIGNLFYDRRRHREAIAQWELAVDREPGNSIAWRNLGIGYYNVYQRVDKARLAYDRAFKASSAKARILYERDQLWKRTGESPSRRLKELTRHLSLVQSRDDLSIELCSLYNQLGESEKALAIIATRNFQPWEGGEGQALGQHVRTHLTLGRGALRRRAFDKAKREFFSALNTPHNLGEAKHLLANQSDIHYWLGCSLAASGDEPGAKAHWTIAADYRADFQGMSVRPFSEMTYYSAQALRKLRRDEEAVQLFKDLLAFAQNLSSQPAKIDYFATSLPTMLLFDEDLEARQRITATFLEAQAKLGLGRKSEAFKLLEKVIAKDPSHPSAADLLAEEGADIARPAWLAPTAATLI